MVKRVAIGTLVGAVILYAWGMLSHTVFPYHLAVMHKVSDEEGLREYLGNLNLEPGFYYFPHWEIASDEAGMKVWTEAFKKGPNGSLFLTRGGDPQMAKSFIGGFVRDFLSALLVAVMCATALPRINRTILKIFFVAAFGVFTSNFTHLKFWIWMDYPLDYTLANCFDAVVMWTLVGIAYSFIINTPKVKAAAA